MSPTRRIFQFLTGINVSAYSALSLLIIFVATLSLAPKWNVSKTSQFPFLGKESGNITQKRQYFMANALQLFKDGYRKVKNFSQLSFGRTSGLILATVPKLCVAHNRCRW